MNKEGIRFIGEQVFVTNLKNLAIFLFIPVSCKSFNKFSIYVFVISSAVDELNKQLPFVFRIACIPLIKNLSGKAPTGTI